MTRQVKGYYFSPTTMTRRTVEHIVKRFGDYPVRSYMFGHDDFEKKTDGEDLLVFGAPVYVGRIPEVARRHLETMRLAGNPVIAVVTYGGRAFDDALLELTDVLREAGGRVIGAAAVPARHSQDRSFLTDRPDGKDFAPLDRMIEDLKRQTEWKEVTEIPGNRPYRPYQEPAFKPITTDACVTCFRCTVNCPTHAIRIIGTKAWSDPEQCISCMSCQEVCGSDARIFPPEDQVKIRNFLQERINPEAATWVGYVKDEA